MKNFWKLKDFSLLSVPYVYIDHENYLADALFAREKITMWFKGEMVRDDSPYCIVFCKVWKRDAERFENTLRKLEDKMLLCGYTDYPEVCDALTELIEN